MADFVDARALVIFYDDKECKGKGVVVGPTVCRSTSGDGSVGAVGA